MKPAERDPARLEYIQESLGLIAEYTRAGPAIFMHERIVQDAVLRRLETLADAASRLSDELKARHPQTRWRDIAGFRNVAAHGYQSIDLTRIWEIVDVYLPQLRAVVDDELRSN